MAVLDVPVYTDLPHAMIVEQAVTAVREAKVARDPYVFRVADLFCGAGGSSTGCYRAIRTLGAVHEADLSLELECVNHWHRAIATHKHNHPNARHHIEDVTVANPTTIVPGGYLDLLLASPECIFHSNARGGKPVNDQRRMQPWAINNWATRLYVRVIVVENVREFVNWGPLCVLPDGHKGPHYADRPLLTKSDPAAKPCNRPDPTRAREYFEAWIASLRGLGYALEYKVLNAADFGDATTRQRFFLIARRDGLPIRWPEPTHRDPRKPALPGDTRKPWRAARDIIRWDRPGRSLLDDPKYKKTPLSPLTRARLARGFELFAGEWAPFFIDLLDLPEGVYQAKGMTAGAAPQPFTCANRSNSRPRSTDEPVATITGAGQGNVMRTDPIVTRTNRTTKAGSGVRDAETPLPTITTHNGLGFGSGEAAPFVMAQRDGNGVNKALRSAELPAYTVTTVPRQGLVDPVIEPVVCANRHNNAPRGADQPIPPATTATGGGVMQARPMAFTLGQHGGAVARSVEQPTHTITGDGAISVTEPTVEPFAVTYNHNGHPHDVDRPLPTQTAKDRFAKVVPVVSHFNGTADQEPRAFGVDEPLKTITAGGNRFGLGQGTAFVFGRHTSGVTRDPDQPIPSPTASGAGGIVQAGLDALVVPYGPRAEARSASLPAPTILTKDRLGIGQPVAFIAPKFGEAPGQLPRVVSIDSPVPTITKVGAGRLTRPVIVELDAIPVEDPDSAALVDAIRANPKRFVQDESGAIYFLDILFRMFEPDELAAAMGFNDEGEYRFTGTKAERTQQIGNAVAVGVASALCEAVLGPILEAEYAEAPA